MLCTIKWTLYRENAVYLFQKTCIAFSKCLLFHFYERPGYYVEKMLFLFPDTTGISCGSMSVWYCVATIVEHSFSSANVLHVKSNPYDNNLWHGLSQQGVWVPFWTPKPLKRTPQDTQIFLCGISKNLKLIIEFFYLLVIPMTLFNDIRPYLNESIHVYG